MNKAFKILECREMHHNLIKKYVNDYQVISLKANISGDDKNLKEAYLLLSYFDKLISKYSFKKICIDDYDGPIIIYLSKCDYSLKDAMVEIEESSSIGRFVDIDVFFNNQRSENRKELRKCFLCDDYAFVCGRERRHSVSDINKFIKKNVFDFCLKTIEEILIESMMTELDLHPKFGLVTKYTNGSHKDMNYILMRDAALSIVPYFKEMFCVAYENSDLSYIFKEIRKIGILAEENMYKITNGVNAYKGLIFALAFLVSSIAYKFANLKDNRSIYEYIKIMAKDIGLESNEGSDTVGKIAYQKYNLKGARFEAQDGYTSIRNCVERYSLDNEESLYEALSYFISTIDDTVLFKRCKNIDLYYEVKNRFKDFKYNKKNIDELNDFCLERNLSFGGSADLLVMAIFLKKVLNKFNIDLFEKENVL